MENMKAIKKFWELKRAMPPIPKNGYNPHTKSHFFHLKDIIAALNTACDKLNMGWIGRQIDGGITDGQFWARHEVTFYDFDSGESVEFQRYAAVDTRMGGAQAFGSDDTYSLRYALVRALGLYEEDDDGNAASGRGVQSNNKQAAEPNGLVI